MTLDAGDIFQMPVANVYVDKNFQSFPRHTLLQLFHFYIYISMSHRTDLTAYKTNHHESLSWQELLGTLSVPEKGFHGFLWVFMDM